MQSISILLWSLRQSHTFFEGYELHFNGGDWLRTKEQPDMNEVGDNLLRAFKM